MYASTSSATKENIIKTVRFETPEYIPMTFHINEACYDYYDRDILFELMEQHPFLFPDFHKPEKFELTYAENARKDQPYKDDFGCIWETLTNGIVGSVHKHPLTTWDKYESYQIPDPEKSNGLGPIDWEAFERQVKAENKVDRQKIYAGVDIGGTNIAAGLVTEDCQILVKKSIPTRPEEGAEVVCNRMNGLLRELAKAADICFSEIEWIGLGIPGTVHSDTGEISFTNNLRFDGVDIKGMMEEKTGRTVYLDNDANAAAYGEAIAGADECKDCV